MPTLRDCVVLHGPELEPRHCARFTWAGDTITALELGAAAPHLVTGTTVVLPGLCNAHTHVGDSALPDGATGLTLEQGFFRPHGYKYRELAKIDPETHRTHIEEHLRYMAATGTVCHLDFREQGVEGVARLRAAADTVGVRSYAMGQFDQSPFDHDELDCNNAPLPAMSRAELEAMLAIADGFSESTMNDLTDVAWREVRDVTRRLGKLRAIHCLENEAYRDVSLNRTGKGDLARAIALLDPHFIVHLTVANEDEIALIAGAGKTAALNPRANATLGLPLPPVAALMVSGTNLLLGTDNVMLNPPNLFAELDFTYRLARSQFGAAQAAAPDPLALLKMVTVNASTVLGDDFPGQLASGGPATFVALDFTAAHLRHTRNLPASIIGRVSPADVLATYRHGRELWRRPDVSFN